jgi:hypothetical protein
MRLEVLKMQRIDCLGMFNLCCHLFPLA